MLSPELAATLKTIHDLTTQNQAQTFDLQSTVNPQAKTIMDLQQRIVNTEHLWHASHSEVHSRVKQIQASWVQSPTGRAHFLIDAKTLVPDNFSGEKHRMHCAT